MALSDSRPLLLREFDDWRREVREKSRYDAMTPRLDPRALRVSPICLSSSRRLADNQDAEAQDGHGLVGSIRSPEKGGAAASRAVAPRRVGGERDGPIPVARGGLCRRR